MFGRNPRSKPAGNTQSFDIDDIDKLLNATAPDAEAEVGIHDADLNDPELLQQLQELTSSNRESTQEVDDNRRRNVNTQKARESHNAKQPQSAMDTDEFDIDQYAALAQGTSDDVHVELDENDMQDPALLKALEALGGGSGERGDVAEGLPVQQEDKSQQHDPQIQQPNESVQQLMGMGFSAKQANHALDMYDNDLERATNYLLDTPVDHGAPKLSREEVPDVRADPPTTDTGMMDHAVRQQTVETATEDMQEHDDESNELLNDPEELQRRIKHYQKLAIAAKRSGDKKKAVELLRHSKGLSQRHQELLQLTSTQAVDDTQDDIMHDTPGATEPTPTPQTDVLMAAPPASSPTPESDHSIPSPEIQNDNKSTATENNQQLLRQIVALQKEYKEAAIHYKNIGNLAACKEMIKTSKDLLRIGIQVKNGQVRDLGAVHDKLPGKPDMSLGDGKLRQIEMVTSGSPSDQTLEHLESQLVYQIDVCHNLAIQSTNTTRRKQKGKALSESGNASYQQLEQAFTADLVSLRSRRDQDLKTTPQLHYELVNYTYKNILDHIPANQMELKIIRGIGLQSFDITNAEPFVTWDFGGWPPENTAQASLGKGETAVQKGTNPDFDASIQIPIMPSNRIFMRYIQRRKLTLEVFHNRYSYGLFRRPVSLGKLAIPLESLLTKCSISGVFDLTDSSRRKTGGKLEIQLNLREPLTGEDIVRRAERWLVIDEFGQDTSSLLASSGLTPMPYQPQQHAAATSAPAQPPLSSTAAVDSPATASASPTGPAETRLPEPAQSAKKNENSISSKPSEANSELEQAEEEYNTVDLIVSNMVLEHELRLVNNALAGKPSAQAKDDLMDRKQALEIKMNMLVIQVQTGMLDMDAYLQDVRKRMERDRQLALIFKKHGRLDLAKGALTRKKIMQDETEEAESAMAAQNE